MLSLPKLIATGSGANPSTSAFSNTSKSISKQNYNSNLPHGSGPGSGYSNNGNNNNNNNKKNDYFSQLLSNNQPKPNRPLSGANSYCHNSSCSNSVSSSYSYNNKQSNSNYRPLQQSRTPHRIPTNDLFNRNFNFNDDTLNECNDNDNDSNINSLCSSNLNINNQILIESVYKDCPFHLIRTEWY